MSHRIETAEILSFRLRVPPDELRLLSSQLKGAMQLSLDTDDGEYVVAPQGGESFLRFRPFGAEAVLTEIHLSNDEQGVFFEEVLGALMVRYGGDLHVRLLWSTPGQDQPGFDDVRISRGATSYPGLLRARGAGAPLSTDGTTAVDTSEPEAERPLTPFEKEISDLLTRARLHWAEYQRLKARRLSGR